MLLMYETSGDDASDSVEIFETENYIYTKCVRIHEITTNPTLQHFVAITDKSTSERKTVGRRMIENGRTDFTFSFTPGDNYDVDYFSQDNTGWSGSGYELYGFFNDTYSISSDIKTSEIVNFGLLNLTCSSTEVLRYAVLLMKQDQHSYGNYTHGKKGSDVLY